MSGVEMLANRIRNALVLLSLPIAQEMAIYSGKKSVYSDLAPLSLSKVAPFTESFMLLGLGDNLSLTLGDGKIIVVSKISERAVLIVVTSQKIGAVLAKLKDIIERYGKELDVLIMSQPIEPPRVVTPVARQIPLPPATVEERAARGVPSPLVPPPPPPTTPTPPPPPPAPSAGIGTFMAPVLVNKAVLKNSAGDEKKILSLCTGRFSIEEISKKTKLPANIVIEMLYRFTQEKTIELREEKKTGEEEAIGLLKRI